MSRSPSLTPSRSVRSQGDYEMHRFHSTPSSQENLVTYKDQTTTEGNKSNLLSLALNFWLLFGPRLLFGRRLLSSLLWIACIICLLWLNFSSIVIGGSAWCRKKPCGVIQYDPESEVTTNSLVNKYERSNHNLLGGLQFAAKALEVWFMYIASSLVYLVAYTLARRTGGLPIGHFLTHLEYADLLWLLNPSLFRIPGVESGRAVVSNRMHTAYLYLFILLAVSMCIIANLIGPSIAVLMLPTLRWQDSNHFNEAYFIHLEAGSPPAGNLTPGCTEDDLSKPDYSCFLKQHGNDVDAMIIGNAVINDKGTNNSFTSQNTVVTYEGILPFIYNTSNPNRESRANTSTMWVPSRQVLRSLSNDFEELYAISKGWKPTESSYTKRFEAYNNSRSLVLQRQGPIVGMQATVDYGNLTTTKIDSDREVLCYHSDIDTVITCFGGLQGRNKANKNYTITSFTIIADETRGLLPIKMRMYWSDRIGQFPSNSSDPCLRNGTATEGNQCDYDTFRPEGFLVMELSRPTSPHPESVWVTTFSLSYGFATYTFDATTIFPNLQNVIVPEPPQPGKTFSTAFDPAWVLAALGVNPDGSLSSSREAVLKLQQSAQAAFDMTRLSDRDYSNFIGALVYTMAQAASLVTFTNSTIHSPWSQPPHTEKRTVLWTNIRREIWGWKIESRTSKLGVGVAIAGILTVLVRTGLLIITREKQRESTEIIAAALQHRYNGEFSSVVKESELACVRYQIGEDEETGKLRFVRA